jgi:hypothetical protein
MAAPAFHRKAMMKRTSSDFEENQVPDGCLDAYRLKHKPVVAVDNRPAYADAGERFGGPVPHSKGSRRET